MRAQAPARVKRGAATLARAMRPGRTAGHAVEVVLVLGLALAALVPVEVVLGLAAGRELVRPVPLEVLLGLGAARELAALVRLESSRG